MLTKQLCGSLDVSAKFLRTSLFIVTGFVFSCCNSLVY